MSNPKMRARQSALSFSEKIKILEKLRDRDRAIAASGLRGRGESDARNEADKQIDLTLKHIQQHR
jgi:hypothetical protein